MHATSPSLMPAAKLASPPDGGRMSRRLRPGRPVALALAGTLGLGLVMPVVTSAPADASTQVIGAVATAFRLADQAAVDNVKVDWSSVAGATTYELLRSESGTSGFQTVASAPGTTFDDYALPTGHTYYYEVRALDGSGATLAQSAAAHASTSTPTGTFSTYDNTTVSSLNLPSSLEANGVFYRFDYQSDANGFVQLVQRTSTDRLTFTGGTVVLSRTSDPALASCKLESMNIRRNPTTGEFVVWAHYENPTDYTLAQVAVAHAVPGQPFTFDGTFRPLDNQSRDLTFFADSDGTGYLVSAANNNADLNLYTLSSDWRTITAQTATLFAGQNREAPAMVHVGGYYYLFTSEAAGWLPSQGQYASATSPAGPWTSLRDAGSTATFGAQSGGIVQIGDQYAMMANRWAANWKVTSQVL